MTSLAVAPSCHDHFDFDLIQKTDLSENYPQEGNGKCSLVFTYIQG